eukprot:98184_1
MFACHLLQLLWDMKPNKAIIDSYISKQLKLRLDDRNKDKSKAPKKSYAESIATKPPPTDNKKKAIKVSNDKSETVKFIAILYLLNGSILRLLPHQMAFESNRANNLPQLTLNRGYICRMMISTNNAVFRSEISGPQHLSLDNLIPIPYLSSCFVSESSDACFDIMLKGISVAISKLFTRFDRDDAAKPNQQLIVSRVTMMLMNALCRALDPMFNSTKSTKKVFARVTSSAHLNTLCNKILTLAKNVIPSEMKYDANDTLPTQMKWDTPMMDLGYLERYVQILQSYLWSNKSRESTIKSSKSHKKKSSKKQDGDSGKHKTYNWPSGPSNCDEARSMQYIFKECRGKKKALICELCRDKPLGAATAYEDIWKHFMIRHYGLLQQYTHLINKELKTLRDKLDGGGDGADGDGASVDPRFKNLNQEYVQTLAIMGFPIEWCQFALAECNNDIAAASDWLLNHLDNIDEIMRQREDQRMAAKRKKIDEKKRKAAQFMMEYEMQCDEMKEYATRGKTKDYLDVLTPINIVKKSNNNNVYQTISNNNSYSINDFGTTYTARAAYKRFELAHLLSRITDKYSFAQVQTLLARAQFYLATMYARKLIALLLFHSHDRMKTEATPMSPTSPATPPPLKEEKEQKDEKEEEEESTVNDDEDSKTNDIEAEDEPLPDKETKKKRKNRSSSRLLRTKIDLNEFGSIPLAALMDDQSKKNPSHLMHLVLSMIHLLTFRGDLFHDFKRSKHKMNDPLHYNIVNENVRLFIRHNLIYCNDASADDNITHKRLSRHLAQHLTKFCIDHLKLLLLNSTQLDNIRWGERDISFRDEQVLSNALLSYEDQLKTHYTKKSKGKSTKKKSKKSKKERKASKKEEQLQSNEVHAPQPEEYVCLERVAMILNELIETNCVEIYTPSVYNILWDSFMLSPNIYVKSMAFKFLSHLEANWSAFASDPLKEAKPKRMTRNILQRLKAMFDRLYAMEKRSDNDHFSVLLNSLSEFLARVNWKQQMNDTEETKEETKDDADEDEIVHNMVYDKNREWNTYKLSDGITNGTAYWTLQINSSRQPTMICVGIVSKAFDCGKCIGSRPHSIGLLGDGSVWRFGHMISSQFTSNKQFEAGTKIAIYLNLNRGELTFIMNGSEANKNDMKHKMESQCTQVIGPQTVSSLVCGVAQSTPSLVSSSNNNNMLQGMIKLNLSTESTWFPAVSLYSQKDAIRLITDECFVRCDDTLPFASILPSPIPKCDEFVHLIRTVIALNKNEFDLIPHRVITGASQWLSAWLRNETRFCRFGAFGYDVSIESQQLKQHKVEVGDLVQFASKTCRIMGEYRGRLVLKNESNPSPNPIEGHLYFVEWKEFDDKIKINDSAKANQFKKKYGDAYEQADEFETDVFEATIQSLTKSDLIQINEQITHIWKTQGKTAFDLTINDFMQHKMAENNMICGFALIRFVNKCIPWLFPLFNPSLFYSFFNQLLIECGDLMFCHLRMSLILHLLTDDVDHGNSSRVKSINLNPFNEKHSLFEQLSTKINTNTPMDTIYRSVMPDRYGQLRIFMPSFTVTSSNNKKSDAGDEGGPYRQLFNMIIDELFTLNSKNEMRLNHLCIQSKEKKEKRIKNNMFYFNNELEVLKLFETLGRIIGLSVRSLLNINIDGIPDWFWDSIWSFHTNDANVSISNECIMSIRKGLFFVLPKQLKYLLNAKQFKLLLCGQCSQYDLSTFSIKQLLMPSSPLPQPETSVENRIVSLLEQSAVYMEPLTRNTAHIEMFWRVLMSLSKRELFEFIKFVSGHNVWPLYITSHSNVSQTNVYSHCVETKDNKKLAISSMNLSADVLYDVEYLNFLIKSYYLYGSIMHNKSNQIHNDQTDYLWIIDECNITFCNQTPAMKASPNAYLPEVHTCTCSIRLPSYESENILKAKVLKAIELCDTFDVLNTPFAINKIVQKRNKTFKSNIGQRLQDLFK